MNSRNPNMHNPNNLGFVSLIVSVAMSAISMGVRAATAGGPEIIYPKFEMSLFLPENKVTLGGKWKEKQGRQLSKKGAYAEATVETVLNAFTCAAVAQSGIGGGCLPRYGGVVIYGFRTGKGSALKMVDDMRNLNIAIVSVYQALLNSVPYAVADKILRTQITLHAIKAEGPKRFLDDEDLGLYIDGLVRVPLIKKGKDSGFATYEFYDEVLKIINDVFLANGVKLSPGNLVDPITLQSAAAANPSASPTVHRPAETMEDQFDERVDEMEAHYEFETGDITAAMVNKQPTKPLGSVFIDPVIDSAAVQNKLAEEEHLRQKTILEMEDEQPRRDEAIVLTRVEGGPKRFSDKFIKDAIESGDETLITQLLESGEIKAMAASEAPPEESNAEDVVNNPLFLLGLAVAPVLLGAMMS